MAGILFYAESSQGWNSLYFVISKLLAMDAAIGERICLCIPKVPGYQWNFLSPESKELFFRLARRFHSMGRDCHLYVSTEMQPPGLASDRARYRIIIPHGSGYGSSSYAVVTYLSSDLYCGHAPQQKPLVFDVLVPQGKRHPEFVPTGNPRNDRFLEYVSAGSERRAEIQARAKRMLGLPPDRKMILIASHWTPDGLLRTFGTGPIQAVSAMEEGFQIIQGAHPKLWDDPQHDSLQFTVRNVRQDGFSSRWIREALVREEARGVNVQWGIENNLAVLACDAMIADHSSIVVEAAILDKPVVCHLRRARFDLRFAYDLYREAVVEFERCGDLPGALREALSDPEAKVAGRERMRSMFAFNLGGASEAISRLILDRYTKLH